MSNAEKILQAVDKLIDKARKGYDSGKIRPMQRYYQFRVRKGWSGCTVSPVAAEEGLYGCLIGSASLELMNRNGLTDSEDYGNFLENCRAVCRQFLVDQLRKENIHVGDDIGEISKYEIADILHNIIFGFDLSEDPKPAKPLSEKESLINTICRKAFNFWLEVKDKYTNEPVLNYVI